MSRIPALDPAAAQGKARDLLDAVQKSLGIIPNMFRVAAQSPAALEGLLGLNGAVAHGTLGPKVREQIALAVADKKRCDYCLSAHTFLGKHAGLTHSDVARARRGRADPEADAAVRFARSLHESHGHPSDAELVAARHAGFSDGEIVEVVAITALNVFTNYLNRVAENGHRLPGGTLGHRRRSLNGWTEARPSTGSFAAVAIETEGVACRATQSTTLRWCPSRWGVSRLCDRSACPAPSSSARWKDQSP